MFDQLLKLYVSCCLDEQFLGGSAKVSRKLKTSDTPKNKKCKYMLMRCSCHDYFYCQITFKCRFLILLSFYFIAFRMATIV